MAKSLSMAAEDRLRRCVEGLSRAEFQGQFGDETQCRAALFELRWEGGWCCPQCGHAGYAELRGRAVYQCNCCKHQVGLTAGTSFHGTRLPLTVWFQALYQLSRSKGAISTAELARRLGTRQPTAWHIKQKLLAALQPAETARQDEPSSVPDDAAPWPAASASAATGAAERHRPAAPPNRTPSSRGPD